MASRTHPPPTSTGSVHLASIKRLIVCCDGTWQGHNKVVSKEAKASLWSKFWPWAEEPKDPGVERNVTSNVTKLGQAINTSQKLEDGTECQQIVYYQAGLGTGMFDTTISGFTGSGLDENVIEAYYFLANNYEPGDEIFLFGFSRGAYTARCVAGLVTRLGLVYKRSLREFPSAYHGFRTVPVGPKWDLFLAENSHKWPRYEHVKVKVVGVWDTVGNLGVPVKMSDEWKEWAHSWFSSYSFHNTNLSDNIEHAFQALALDETRAPFSPTMWHLPRGSQTELVQCWFPGIHVNCGGGCEEGLKDEKDISPAFDMEELADITFAWMLDCCAPYLSIDPEFVHITKRIHDEFIRAAPPGVTRGWAIGPTTEHGGWVPKVFGTNRRSPGQYDDKNETVEDFVNDTNEYMHPSVRIRREKLGDKWRSPGLEGFKLQKAATAVKGERKSGWEWVRPLGKGKPVVVIPEWKSQAPGQGTPGFERMLMGDDVCALVDKKE